MANGKDATQVSGGDILAGTSVAAQAGWLGGFLGKTFLGVTPLGWLSLGFGAFSIFKGSRDKAPDKVGTQGRKTALRFGISPAQHILGEIVDEGVLVYVCQGPNTADSNLNGNTLHLVIALQVGEADSITGVSLNKRLVPTEVERDYTRLWPNAGDILKPSRGIPAGLRRTRIIPYLTTRDAAGNYLQDRGASVRHAYQQSKRWAEAHNAQKTADEPTIPIPDEFTTDHIGDDIAFIHVELTNTAAGEWQQFPDDLEFRIRGVKPNIPTSANRLSPQRQAELGYTGPRWSDNAAALMYWYLTEIRHIHPSRIDIESFLRAYDVCERRYGIDYGDGSTLQLSGYSNHASGYSINGKIVNTDDPVKIERELRAAMAGGFVFDNGTFYIYAGMKQQPKWTITENDVLEITQDQMGSGASRNIIGVRIGLAQSREHDYQALDLPPVRERDTPQAGGEIVDYGTRAFVTDPIQGQYLAGLALQQERDNRTVSIVVSPGENYERMGMRVGDAVTLILPDLGDVRTWIIQDKMIDSSLRMKLVFNPELDYTHDIGVLPRKSNYSPPGGGAGAVPGVENPTPEGGYGYDEA